MHIFAHFLLNVVISFQRKAQWYTQDNCFKLRIGRICCSLLVHSPFSCQWLNKPFIFAYLFIHHMNAGVRMILCNILVFLHLSSLRVSLRISYLLNCFPPPCCGDIILPFHFVLYIHFPHACFPVYEGLLQMKLKILYLWVFFCTVTCESIDLQHDSNKSHFFWFLGIRLLLQQYCTFIAPTFKNLIN